MPAGEYKMYDVNGKVILVENWKNKSRMATTSG